MFRLINNNTVLSIQ